MPVTFSIAQTDTERHDCRGLAVQLNGAPFCSPTMDPAILVNGLNSFRPRDIVWVKMNDGDQLIGAAAFVVGVLTGAHHLGLCVTMSPDYATVENARRFLIEHVPLLDCHTDEQWTTIVGADSPMLDLLLEVYGVPEHATMSEYHGPDSGLVRLEGRFVNGLPGGVAGDD